MNKPQEANVTEVMHAVMPDFPKWNRLFFKLDCVFALINLLITSTFFIYFKQKEMISSALTVYLIQHLILPSTLNFIILIVAGILRKKLSESDMRQNSIPIVAMMLMNFVVCLIPDVFFVALAVFCIPICMTTVYSNSKLCLIVTASGVAGVITASVRHFIGAITVEDKLIIFPQSLIAICILITLGKVAETALRMTNGQKEKLIGFAIGIKKEQHKAEEANEAKSIFLANMSHEIRTPINAILGMNEMILREAQIEQVREYAQSIHSAGNSLLYLVNDVLDISKIESGKFEINENVYELSSFIHDCYIMVAEKAKKKGLELIVSCDPTLPSRLKGDESRLRQVVTNLLSNAAKYTEKGKITLSFEQQQSGEQIQLIINVKDTGIGIKKEDKDKIFSEFTRFDIDKNRNIEGTGLGLSLAKRLTDLMHGTIELDSIYGLGTSATFTVPQIIIDSEPIGNFEEKYLSGTEKDETYHQSFEASNAKILVVDDVAVNLKVITNLLKPTCIKVDTADSGKKCLEMVQQKAYDIIFMDHMMPEMDGVETYENMKRLESNLNKNTPIIMLTANAVTGAREQFLKTGFADYLSKPVNGNKLESIILKYLPKEKQGRTDNRPVDDTEYTLIIADLAMSCPNLDISKGLETCNNNYTEYFELLQTYIEGYNIETLNNYLKQKDILNYQTCIHGIKSSSISVGLTELSKQAQDLEQAVIENNSEFIQVNHPKFIEEYKSTIDSIKEILDTLG